MAAEVEFVGHILIVGLHVPCMFVVAVDNGEHQIGKMRLEFNTEELKDAGKDQYRIFEEILVFHQADVIPGRLVSRNDVEIFVERAGKVTFDVSIGNKHFSLERILRSPEPLNIPNKQYFFHIADQARTNVRAQIVPRLLDPERALRFRLVGALGDFVQH